MTKQETNWEEEWKNEFSCLFSVYKEVNGKEKRMMEESIKFIKNLLSTTRNEVIKEIEENIETFLNIEK